MMYLFMYIKNTCYLYAYIYFIWLYIVLRNVLLLLSWLNVLLHIEKQYLSTKNSLIVSLQWKFETYKSFLNE